MQPFNGFSIHGTEHSLFSFITFKEFGVSASGSFLFWSLKGFKYLFLFSLSSSRFAKDGHGTLPTNQTIFRDGYHLSSKRQAVSTTSSIHIQTRLDSL